MSLKTVLCFGANSYVAKAFLDRYSNDYNLLPVYRVPGGSQLHVDFESEISIASFASLAPEGIGGMVFFQGVNPSVGLDRMSFAHLIRLMTINIGGPLVLIRSLKSKLEPGCSSVFFSSVAGKKGSYDPAYAAAKAAVKGMVMSLANALPQQRFNALACGLIAGSPVHAGMTADFVEKHTARMFENKLIDKNDVIAMVNELLINSAFNRQEVCLDGGYT